MCFEVVRESCDFFSRVVACLELDFSGYYCEFVLEPYTMIMIHLRIIFLALEN